MTFAQTYNPFSQVATATSPESSQEYAYDGASRLVGVGDNFEGSCTTRNYTLDYDSNRSGYGSAPTTPVGGWCPTSTSVSPTLSSSSSFDVTNSGNGGTDRIISSTWTTSSGSVSGSYAYDVLGRQTTIPGIDTQAGGTTAAPNNVTLTYRSDDLVSSISQGSSCESFTYDPLGNVLNTSNYSGTCTGTPSTTATSDYAGSPSPAWTTTGSSTIAFIDGITQGNAFNVTLAGTSSTPCLGISTATCTLNLTDMRGDIVATAALTSGTGTVSGYSETTEFGLPRSATTEAAVAPTYGWLGVHEKAANNLSGLVLMGVRVYNPTTGIFSSPDPIFGGNANPYVYPSDPINLFDLSGEQAPPPEVLAYNEAVAKHKAFCKAHPGILGRSCGGFFHEVAGTLGKIVDKIVNNKALNCIIAGVVAYTVAAPKKEVIGSASKYASISMAELFGTDILGDTPWGLLGLGIVAGVGCISLGQVDITP